MATTIQLDNHVKTMLDSLKIHRETYNDLLIRLLENHDNKVDVETLVATIEVLSDPELMRGIGEALQEKDGISWEKIKKDLSLNV